MEKKYYWLKLQKDFFSDIRVKKLRKLAGGDTYTCIYLKMLLMSLETDGVLSYPDTGDTFEQNLALDIDEDEENTTVLCAYLLRVGLMEELQDGTRLLTYVLENTGTETAAAKRMRAMRERNNVTLSLQESSGTVTLEKEIEIDNNPSDSPQDYLARSSASTEPEAPVEALITNTGAVWRPDMATYEEYKRLYPNVDIDDQFRAMRAWCIGNPKKRKTASGMKRFVASWLESQQNKPKGRSEPERKRKPGFHDFEQRTYDYDALMRAVRADG